MARRSTRVAWALVAAWVGSAAALLALSLANGSFQRQPLANTVGLLLAFAAFMVVGVLIVAHRPGNAIGWVFDAIALLAVVGALYEIDRLINRTLVYGLLTALLAAVYAGLVVLLGRLSGELGGRPPSWVVAGATLAVATLFQPARRAHPAGPSRRPGRRRPRRCWRGGGRPPRRRPGPAGRRRRWRCGRRRPGPGPGRGGSRRPA